MKRSNTVSALLVAVVLISSAAFGVELDRKEFSDADGFELDTREDGLTISWQNASGKRRAQALSWAVVSLAVRRSQEIGDSQKSRIRLSPIFCHPAGWAFFLRHSQEIRPQYS